MKRGGFTLVETIMAMLLMAVVVAGAMSVLLSTTANSMRARRSMDVNRYVENLREQLRPYVGNDLDKLPNHGHFVALDSSWEDGCNNCSGPTCPALESAAGCVHDVTKMLPDDFRQNYNATLTYTVNDVVQGGHTLPIVNVNIDWQEPNP